MHGFLCLGRKAQGPPSRQPGARPPRSCVWAHQNPAQEVPRPLPTRQEAPGEQAQDETPRRGLRGPHTRGAPGPGAGGGARQCGHSPGGGPPWRQPWPPQPRARSGGWLSCGSRAWASVHLPVQWGSPHLLGQPQGPRRKAATEAGAPGSAPRPVPLQAGRRPATPPQPIGPAHGDLVTGGGGPAAHGRLEESGHPPTLWRPTLTPPPTRARAGERGLLGNTPPPRPSQHSHPVGGRGPGPEGGLRSTWPAGRPEDGGVV